MNGDIPYVRAGSSKSLAMTMLRPPLCSRLSQEHPKYKQTAAAAKAIPAEVDGEEEGVAHDRPPDPDPHEST